MQQATMEVYLGVWGMIQTLKRAGYNWPIDTPLEHLEDSVIDMLYNLMKALPVKADEPDNAFRVFQGVQSKREDLRQFIDELEAFLLPANEQEASSVGSAIGRKLGSNRRRLKDLMNDLEKLFKVQVFKRPIFVPLGPDYLLRYQSLRGWLNESQEKVYVNYLPRLAKTHFEDAAQCLVYETPHAAASLALQAVEATLRYFFNRHDGDRKISQWGPMLNWLNDRNCLPAGNCYQLLSNLRLDRNSMAHGRAYRGAESIGEAEKVFQQCWQAAYDLAIEISKRKQLQIKIRVNPNFDFDTALATYLFYWDPELPQPDNEAVGFDPSVGEHELIDEGLGKSLAAGPDQCLSYVVQEHLRVEHAYYEAIRPLLDFAARRPDWKVNSPFKPDKPDAADLADLFGGIRRLEKNRSSSDPLEAAKAALSRIWQMLDKFLEVPGLGPGGPRLVVELDQQEAYKARFEMD